MPNPAVFIGSSTDALPVARIVRDHLRTVAKVQLWDDGFFEPGLTTIESLERNLTRFDFGVFVFASDDVLMVQDSPHPVVRDNVVFELGLFMGMHGRSRTSVIYDAIKRPRILSDLAGVTLAPFSLPDYPDLQKELKPACDKVVLQMRNQIPEKWTTTWQMPSGQVDEELVLFVRAGQVTGRRFLSNTQTEEYLISGRRVLGCDALTYYCADGSGSGTILLHQLGAGIADGSLTYFDAHDTVKLRSLVNKWRRV